MGKAVLAILAAMSVAAAPATQPAGKKHAGTERTLHAMIAGIEAHKLEVSVLRKKSEVKERSIRVGKSTVITLNQQPVALSALKAGENVTIKLSHGVATHIDATGN